MKKFLKDNGAGTELQMALVAAADGIKCGASANNWLLEQDEATGEPDHEHARDGQRTAAIP